MCKQIICVKSIQFYLLSDTLESNDLINLRY